MDTLFTVWYVGFLLTCLLFSFIWLKQGYNKFSTFLSGLFFAVFWPSFYLLVFKLVLFGKNSQ